MDELAHMLSLSPFTVLTIILMCGVCGFIVGQLLDSIPATLMIYCGFAGSTILANRLWRLYEVNFVGNRDLDAIVATTAGLVCGVVVFVALKLTLTVMFGFVRKVPKTDLSMIYADHTGPQA